MAVDLKHEVKFESQVHVANRKGRSAKVIIVRVLIALVLIGGAAGARIHWSVAQNFETTDDAQVDGSIHVISSRIAGHVSQVLIEDQQTVQAGDVLVMLETADFEVAVAQARADFAGAIAALESARVAVPIRSMTTSSTLALAKSARLDSLAATSGAEQQLGAARARLLSAQANARAGEANFNKASQDAVRYKALVEKDDVSKQQYDQVVAAAEAARAAFDAQKAQVAEAQQNILVAEKFLEQAKARVEGADAQIQAAMTGPDQVKTTETEVQSAAAKVQQQRGRLDQALLNLRYTTIVAPVSGVVGRKTVELGNNISAGQQMMAIVPVDGIWITANFKETQLKHMRVGQPVRIRSDAYDREYTGRVLRIAGASGARFSLLPPENATGNFVKVVQRIPVRIGLDPGQNEDHLLRPGMSVVPSVRVE